MQFQTGTEGSSVDARWELKECQSVRVQLAIGQTIEPRLDELLDRFNTDVPEFHPHWLARM